LHQVTLNFSIRVQLRLEGGVTVWKQNHRQYWQSRLI